MLRRSLLSLGLLALLAAVPFGSERIIGFSQSASDAQYAMEARYDGLLNPSDLDGWMKHMTSKPQHVGSPWSKANAEYVADLFESWGFETEIEVFHVLMPTPLERSLELVAPTRYTALL
ncbi:folate hydrolase, partial [bacterium]|nr:folate hydrolase [bacterium]